MYVNPFWFGVLLTIVAEIIIVFVITFIQIKLSEKEEEEHDATGHTGKSD